MCNSKDILLLLAIANMYFLSLGEKKKLCDNIDTIDALALLSINDISNIIGRVLKTKSWNGSDCKVKAQYALKVINAFNIKLVFYDDLEYPVLLKEIVNAPFVLFCRGNINCLKDKTVSVVGTRKITPFGKSSAISFANDATLDGVTVVSGLAYGVDGACHSGAIEHFFNSASGANNSFGKTIAVLPCGADMIVPSGHKKLAEKILLSGGCLVSEYVPGTPSESWRYVHRNRIIAAFSPATVIIEAPISSGALITAQYAVEYNRDVMFHEAAFSEQAKQVSMQIKAELEKKVAIGKIGKQKLENTAERYLSDGAPVIKNYKDYCKCIKEAPGERVNIF